MTKYFKYAPQERNHHIRQDVTEHRQTNRRIDVSPTSRGIISINETQVYNPRKIIYYLDRFLYTLFKTGMHQTHATEIMTSMKEKVDF